MNEVFSILLLPCAGAFIACIGFCLVFNVHGPGMVVCGFGGALGWLAYLLCSGSIFIRYAVAAVVITLYAEAMARIRRCPVTGYLVIALLPLVPGSGIYDAMRYCVSGNTTLFLSTLLRTFGLAGALALGALVGSTTVRMLTNIRNHRANPHPSK